MGKEDLRAKLHRKDPASLRQSGIVERQPVVPVDILKAVGSPDLERRGEKEPDIEIEEIRTENTNEKKNEINQTINRPIKTDKKKRVTKSRRNISSTSRTKKPRLYSERDIEALLAIDKREKERYSFEIFTDQKEDLQQLCSTYEEKTGNYLSASRVLRELLDSFLPGALKSFSNEDE